MEKERRMVIILVSTFAAILLALFGLLLLIFLPYVEMGGGSN